MDDASNDSEHSIMFKKLDKQGERLTAMEAVVAVMNETVKSNAETQQKNAEANTETVKRLEKLIDLVSTALFPNEKLRSKGLIQKVEDQDVLIKSQATLIKRHSDVLKYSGVAVGCVWAVVSNFDKIKMLVQ